MEAEETDVAAEQDEDIVASFVSVEIQNEIRRLQDEQKILRREIDQLREERDFLFDLLHKKEEPPILSFSREALTIGDDPPSNSEATAIDSKSASARQNGTLFSKVKLMDEMRKYQNKTFKQAAEVIKHAQNGDSIIKYLVNFCGTKMDSMEQEMQLLQDESAKSSRRATIVNSPRSIASTTSEQTKTICSSMLSDESIPYV